MALSSFGGDEPPLGVIREQEEWEKVRGEQVEDSKIRKEQGNLTIFFNKV